MLIIYNENTDPYFNMAVEEFLFNKFNDNIFMLWRNDNAIIVGKHQNTLSEINLEKVKEYNVKVIRRLSGGGAVFHDLGNLNFTFIMNQNGEEIVNFKKFTQPIIDVLNDLGVPAKFEGRNDLTINGKKFSGNAVHVSKNRMLQHGTILFASEIKNLNDVLKVNPLKYKDKAVKSVKARVTNVSEHLKEKITLNELIQLIFKRIKQIYPDSKNYEFTDKDINEINKLVVNKYSTWDWNFGWHSKYDFEKLIHTNGGNIEFHLNVDDGIIKDCKIYGDYFNIDDTYVIEKILIGTKHEENEIRKKLQNINIDNYFKNVSLDEIIEGLF